MIDEIITTTLVKNKRHRRSNDVLAVLDQQILNALSACWPQSVRHIFYKMTDPGLAVPVPKSDHGAGNGYAVVQRRMSQMRVNGSLLYSWVTDYTRRGFHVKTYGSATEFLRRTAGLYRADAWKQAESYVEVWCESRSIAGVIEDLCDELGVSLYPSGGSSSLTLVFNCAEYIKGKLAETGKPVNVIRDLCASPCRCLQWLFVHDSVSPMLIGRVSWHGGGSGRKCFGLAEKPSGKPTSTRLPL